MAWVRRVSTSDAPRGFSRAMAQTTLLVPMSSTPTMPPFFGGSGRILGAKPWASRPLMRGLPS